MCTKSVGRMHLIPDGVTSCYSRSVTLADCARFITLQTINGVVYDLDNLVNTSTNCSTETEVTEDTMQTPSNSVCMCIPGSCPSLEDENGAGKLSEGDLGITVGQGGGDSEDPGTAEISSLHFESRFECGNLRKAIQVYTCTGKWSSPTRGSSIFFENNCFGRVVLCCFLSFYCVVLAGLVFLSISWMSR